MKQPLLALALVGAFATTAAAANPVVEMKTSKGTIKIELFEDKAPETVKNFLKYVDDKHYDGLVFHRVMSTFMIQGGGFEKGFAKSTSRVDAERKQRKTRDPIKNESSNGLTNQKYTIAMARTPKPHTATSQFFINVKDNDTLNKERSRDGYGYCVFGKVTAGMDVVDKIKDVETHDDLFGFEAVPKEDVVIESVKRADK